jgi:hypothetical protein
MHLKLLLAAILSVVMIAAAHAQEGARAYFPVPAGTNDIEITATFAHLESTGTVIDSATVTPSYRHTFDLGGDSATFLIGLPLGKVSGTFDFGGGPFTQETNPAQGDLFIGGTIGLVNAPALTPMAYAQYQPGFSASAVARVFMPTGAYDSTLPNLVNLGQNRWTFEAMLPMSYVMGTSLIDPNLTTFELIPTLQIFGDNNSPVGGATVSSQAPLFGVEAHVTHSFSPMVWASVDGYTAFGGETSINGVAQNNSQQSLSAGATLGLTLSQSVALRLSYQQQVYSNLPNTASRTFMATTAFLF